VKTIEQAGAVVLRRHKSSHHVLLITSKRDSDHWLFPKGHIERGETLEEAALREAEEEAGIRGTIVGRAGDITFELKSESVLVHYFVVTTEDDGRPEKGRSLAWCSYEDALERLTFSDTRGLLKKVWKNIET
jgi:8-oxo-dGTP pyrophosphatase MutT (NUDIX family)